MTPEIKNLAEKMLIGKRIKMCLSDDKTLELWKSFMPHRKEISNKLDYELFSIQIFDDNLDFAKFNPQTVFEKWAALEVSDFGNIPAEMETLIIPGGLYAVSLYRGSSAAAAKTFQYIFENWLPNSIYTLDQRPHFEIMGEKYKNDDPNSEEEIWIPIKLKVKAKE
jgi:AraC family transcriptional regulator